SHSVLPLGAVPERVDRLCDAESSLIERSADDHAAERAGSGPPQGGEVSERTDAAGIDQLGPARLAGDEDSAEPVEPRAGERPVDLDWGEDEPADPASAEVGDRVLDGGVGRLLPAGDGDAARARVDRCDDPL